MVKKIYAVSLLRCMLTLFLVKSETCFPETTEIKILSEKTDTVYMKDSRVFEKEYNCYEITRTLQCECENDNMIVQHTVIAGIDYDSDGNPYVAQATKPVSYGGGGRFEWESIMSFSDIPLPDKLVSYSTGQFTISEMVELNPVGVMMPGMFYDASFKQKWHFRSDGVDIWLDMTAEEIIASADKNNFQ